MAITNVGYDSLQQMLNELERICDKLQSTKMAIDSRYQGLSSFWGGKKYHELGLVLSECRCAIDEVTNALQQGKKTVNIMMKYVGEYEEISLTRHSTTSEGNASNLATSNVTNNVQTIESIGNWIGDINPNYYRGDLFSPGDDNPYEENCGSCAYAVESRLSGRNTSAVASACNIGTDAAMEDATGRMCVYMPVSEIEQHLISMGAGSHLIVGINRHRTPTGRPQAGHWFNAYYDGNRVYTIDGQDGSINDWPYDYGDVSEWCALI